MSNTHSPSRRRVNRCHTHHSESSGTKTSTCVRHHIIPHPNPVYLTAPNMPTDSKHSENAMKSSPPYTLPSPSLTYPSLPHSTHPLSPHKRTPRSSKSTFYFPPVPIVMCATHASPTWTQGRCGNKDESTLRLRPRSVYKRWGALEATMCMAIEEHQAGKLGVQRLHYLYTTLKATTAYGSQ